MKKRFFALIFTLLLACAFCLTACPGPEETADPDKTDAAVYDVSKLYSAEGLQMPAHVKELKEENGGWTVKTETDISSSAKMTLDVIFEDGKFNDVVMTVAGTDKNKYESALEVRAYNTPEPSEGDPTPEPELISRKTNDPARVKGFDIRLPRSGGRNDVFVTSGQNAYNAFNFDTKPETGDASDHQVIGTAAFDCLEYAVAAYRFVLAAKNVFGSYANYMVATEKAVVSGWTFGGTLVTSEAASANVKIEKVLEFPKSYVVFAASSAPEQRSQEITVMVRIDKATHKVLKADYAFYHVSEYHSGAANYIMSLYDAKQQVLGADASAKVYSGMLAKEGGIIGTANATLTNSVLVNAFNAAFAYYKNNLKA